MAHKVGTGIVTGVVSEDGIPKAGAIVTIYDRDTNKPVYRAECGPTGEYTFSGLDHTTDTYYVMVQDDDGVVKKNALIQDYVQPINGAIGSSFNANWYIETKKHNPVFLIAAQEYTSKLQIDSSLMSCYTGQNVGHGGALAAGTLTLAAQTHMAGAPDLKSVVVTTGYLQLFNSAYYSAIIQNALPVSGSIEKTCIYIVDVTKPSQVMQRPLATNQYNYLHFSLSSAFLITVKFAASSGSATTLLTYTIPAGAGRTGFHSISTSFSTESGGIYKLYFDGVEVATGTNAGADISAFGSVNYGNPALVNNLGYTSIAGYAINNDGSFADTSANLGFSFMAIFDKYMQLAEITEILDSLNVVSPPKATGFRKEVALDTPQIYFPLNDTEQDTFKEGFVNSVERQKMPIPPMVLKSISDKPLIGKITPVLGQYGTRFSGNSLLEYGDGEKFSTVCPVGPGAWFFSYEAWVKLAAIPTTQGNIMTFRDIITDNEISTFHITTNRQVSLFFRSTVNDTVTFTPVLNVDEFYHIFVTIDRPAGQALLYLNGVLVDTKSCGLTAITHASVTYGRAGRFTIGGEKLVSGRTRNKINATLFGLAVYNRVISAARIQAHYDARLIA